ncbi:hypothetical protein [Bacteroides timonensis]|uniref:hypothetical protein n=1 Tax=Bacteroides timonensis TaxID=1470345 RepID=UPI0004ACF458|nr:hypothetical protein [Bacteroides timonensis]
MGERLVIRFYPIGQPGKRKGLFSRLFLRLKDWFMKILNVDFDLEITSVGSYVYKPKDNGNIQLVERKVLLNGRLAPPGGEVRKEEYENTLSSRLKVNIHASGLSLPKGVLAILDMYTNSIRPTGLNEKP